MTKILLDKVTNLTSKLKIASTEASDEVDLKKLSNRSEQISEIKENAFMSNSLIKSMNSLDGLDLDGLDLEISIDFSNWVKSYKEFRQILSLEGDDIQALNQEKVREFVNKSKDFFNDVKQKLILHWKEVCHAIVNPQSIDGFEILNQIPSNVRSIRIIKAQSEELEQIKAQLPENFDGEINKLKEIAKIYKEAFDGLDTSGLDPSVKKFLAALKSQTCTLSEVDETVLRWLKDQQSSKKYRVSPQPW